MKLDIMRFTKMIAFSRGFIQLKTWQGYAEKIQLEKKWIALKQDFIVYCATVKL